MSQSLLNVMSVMVRVSELARRRPDEPNPYPDWDRFQVMSANEKAAALQVTSQKLQAEYLNSGHESGFGILMLAEIGDLDAACRYLEELDHE